MGVMDLALYLSIAFIRKQSELRQIEQPTHEPLHCRPGLGVFCQSRFFWHWLVSRYWDPYYTFDCDHEGSCYPCPKSRRSDIVYLARYPAWQRLERAKRRSSRYRKWCFAASFDMGAFVCEEFIISSWRDYLNFGSGVHLEFSLPISGGLAVSTWTQIRTFLDLR